MGLPHLFKVIQKLSAQTSATVPIWCTTSQFARKGKTEWKLAFAVKLAKNM